MGDDPPPSTPPTASRSRDRHSYGDDSGDDSDDELALPSHPSDLFASPDAAYEKYDDDELREIAAALIPDVSELLSDAALEGLFLGGDDYVPGKPSANGGDGAGGTENGTPDGKRRAKAKKSPGRRGETILDGEEDDCDTDSDDGDGDGARGPGRRNRLASSSSGGGYGNGSSSGYGLASSSGGLEEDDGLHRELRRLGAAEDSLREELEMAGGFGMMMRGGPRESDSPEMRSAGVGSVDPPGLDLGTGDATSDDVERVRTSRSLLDDTVSDDDEDDDEDASGGVDGPHALPTPRRRERQEPRPYTLADHADVLRVTALPADLGRITAPLLSRRDVAGLFVVPSVPNFGHDAFTEGGMGLGQVWSEDGIADVDSAYSGVDHSAASSKSVGGTDEEREEYVRLTMDCAREYVEAPSSADLRRLYVGLAPPTDVAGGGYGAESPSLTPVKLDGCDSSDSQRSDGDNDGGDTEDGRRRSSEPLPVRTVVVRVRPDVLCGAIMDALSHAVENVGGEMTKRQGGHLRAVLPGYWLSPRRTHVYSKNQYHGGVDGMMMDGGDDASDMDSVSSGLASLMTFSPDGHVGKRSVSRRAKARMRMMPPTLVDAQLVSRKRSRECERVLMIRTYRMGGGSGAEGPARFDGPVTSNTYADGDNVVEEDEDGDGGGMMSGTLIREAASLVQRMEEEGEHSSPVLPTTPGGASSAAPGHSSLSSLGNILTSPLRLLSGYGGESGRGSGGSHLTPGTAGGGGSAVFPDPSSVTEAVSFHLLQHYRPTPSVEAPTQAHGRDSTIPSLSDDDWPYVRSAWRFLKECLNELDNRDLAYSTLSTCPFGAFPALPTVDVQYCSQIRLLCRENMILSLLKSAAELEQFARESEYQCANLIQLLRPTFDMYGLAPPALPTPVPLTAYPLDFQAPEAACPPWGQRVMKAMNRVAAMSSMDGAAAAAQSPSQRQDDADGGGATTEVSVSEESALARRLAKFRRARDAVSLVVQAFQRQADEEQSARMGRKNIQVMDRLAKMQAHKRASIITIRDSYGCNPTVTKGADDFHARAKQAAAKKAENDPEAVDEVFFAESDQVPLLTCGILVGGSTGTCYVTAHQILFVTKVIPLVGSSRCWVFPVNEIELDVEEPSGSVLNPLPAGLVLREINDEGDDDVGSGELFSFIPSIAAQRLKAFIDVLRAVSTENPETLKFSARGGLLYMFEEKKSIARSAMGGGATGTEPSSG